MSNSQANEQHKGTARKGGVTKSSGKEERDSTPTPKTKTSKRSASPDPSPSSLPKHVVTQEEFRARVLRKAFELYERRRAITEVDDWIEAERLVKKQLLSDDQEAGSV